jgi:hypothetical protein
MSIITAIIGSSSGSPPPSYYLDVNGTYNEGQTVSLVLNYQYATGSTVYWSIVSGTATNGVDYTTNSGNFNGSLSPTGTGSVTVEYINLTADNTTEGNEYYTVRLGSYSGGYDLTNSNVGIGDTSTTPIGTISNVILSIAGNPATEGVAVNVTVTTSNFADGTTLAWWKASGSADISDFTHQTGDNIESGDLSGTFTISSNQSTFSILPRADMFTEGTESLVINFGSTDRSILLWNQSMTIGDTSTLGALMVPFSTTGIPTTVIDGAVWPAYDGSGGSPSGIIHGDWSRDTSLGGSVIFNSGSSYVEFPTRVTRTSFTIEMVANFVNVGGWQTIWDTGSMNEGGVGYTCFTPNGPQLTISTNYGTGSEGQVSFTLGSLYEGLAHWVFVVDFISGENCKVYRNGSELTKVGSTAVAPLSYGTKPLMIGARRGPSFSPTDYARGKIYFVGGATTAYDANSVATVLNARRNIYGQTLDGQPAFGYNADDPVNGQTAIFGVNAPHAQFSGDWTKVTSGWQVVAVGGTHDGWVGTIVEVGNLGPGSFRIAHNNPGGVWPQDATSFKLRPF